MYRSSMYLNINGRLYQVRKSSVETEEQYRLRIIFICSKMYQPEYWLQCDSDTFETLVTYSFLKAQKETLGLVYSSPVETRLAQIEQTQSIKQPGHVPEEK